jgi:hypothetical protein
MPFSSKSIAKIVEYDEELPPTPLFNEAVSSSFWEWEGRS